jgi:hypothetical protein
VLLGDEDQSHAALADLFQQLVRADQLAGRLGRRVDSRAAGYRWGFQEAALLEVNVQQF